MKLGALFDKINMTQTGHSTSIVSGKPMNHKAFDFSSKSKLIAPLDCNISYAKSAGEASEFMIDLEGGSRIYILHAYPIRKGGFKKGEVICNAPISIIGGLPDHYHVAIMVNGAWDQVVDYIDRTLELFWYGGKKSPNTDWSTYPDKHLNLPITENKNMFTFRKPIKCVTTNTVEMNIRMGPSTQTPVVGKCAPATSFLCEAGQDGEVVNNVKQWYKYSNGWISGAYVNEIQDNTALEAQIILLRKVTEAQKADLVSINTISKKYI